MRKGNAKNAGTAEDTEESLFAGFYHATILLFWMITRMPVKNMQKGKKKMARFKVIDKTTGKEADEYEIARTEELAKDLCYCDMDGFAIMQDGSLILCDECGRFACCDESRFSVVWEEVQIPVNMPIKEAGRKAERKTITHEEAVGFLQESGWLQDHDRQIYEQGKRDGIEERKKGKWEIEPKHPMDSSTFAHIKCTECGERPFGDFPTLYCPHCGAEMEGAEE